jgi:hypothetical protein
MRPELRAFWSRVGEKCIDSLSPDAFEYSHPSLHANRRQVTVSILEQQVTTNNRLLYHDELPVLRRKTGKRVYQW